MMFYDYVSIKMNIFQDGLYSFFFFMVFKEIRIFLWAFRSTMSSRHCSHSALFISPLAYGVVDFSAAAHPEHAGRAILQQWSPDIGAHQASIPPLSSGDSDPGFLWTISPPHSQADSTLARGEGMWPRSSQSEYCIPAASVINSGGGAPGTSWKEALRFLEGTERVWGRLGASFGTTQSGLVGNKVNRKEGRAKRSEREKVIEREREEKKKKKNKKE